MPDSYDVIVAGGGSGGFGAAIGAARAGARVLLLEKYGFLGGAATNSNVLAFCGLFENGGKTEPVPAVGGANDVLMAELNALGMDTSPKLNSNTGNWLVLLEPERLKLAMDRCLAEAGVDVLLHARTGGVQCDGSAVQSIAVEAHEGPQTIAAGAFVDATGDGHLVRRVDTGAGHTEANASRQPYTAPLRIGGLPEGLTIDRASLAEAVADYNRTGAYPIHRANGGFFAPIPGSDDMWWMVIDIPCEDATSAELTKAEMYLRRAAHDYIALLRRVQPETAKAELVQSGPQVGIRESGHGAAQERVTESDLLNGRLRPDGVARATWPMEDYVRLGKAKYTQVGGVGYAHVPLGALQARNASNLYLAGRAIGADAMAYASVRVMGTAFATGFAAGVAAANTGDAAGEIVSKVSKFGGLI
ncbi:FAD-dependent oxidoreductase [Pseudoroseicyclus sp. H15]